MYKHILIATDGSALADKGIAQGLSLAEQLSARVTVLTVAEPMSGRAAHVAMLGGVRDPVSLYDQRIDADMKERFAPIERRASEHGIAFELLHEVDVSPAKAIVRIAHLKQCDVIVMSSHGHYGFRSLLLGSQTKDVLMHTTIPILVIR